MKKLGMFLLMLLLCVYLSGCSKIVKLVDDTNSEDNPLSGKSTDERIIMCLNEEYPEHDFDVIESFNKENDSGKFEDENGVEFTVHGLVYDNTYHFGCRNDYLKILLEQQDYLSKINTIAEEYGFSVDYSDETIGIEGNKNENESDIDAIDRISKMLQRILNSVDTPQIVYPKAAGSFSTGEVNYYSRPCMGTLLCDITYNTSKTSLRISFEDKDLSEEQIKTKYKEKYQWLKET